MVMKKTNTNPLGVPLGDLMHMLQSTSIKTTLEGSTLLAAHEHYTVRVEVLPPESQESEHGPIRAVVRLTTELPQSLQGLFDEPEKTVPMNAFAALGSLSVDQNGVYIGSRLTIYENEDSWDTLHLPLLLFTIISGAEAILGGMRRTFSNESQAGGSSDWAASDFEQVQSYLSSLCSCTADASGLSAEIRLDPGEGILRADCHVDAQFQLICDQPHPELGGGLFCLLQMPHQLPDQNQLRHVCLQLNNMEMAARDLPPHFGAWCEGKVGNNPAYVSFLPNALHSASGIAVNTAYWALFRATWANATLNSLDVPS